MKYEWSDTLDSFGLEWNHLQLKNGTMQYTFLINEREVVQNKRYRFSIYWDTFISLKNLCSKKSLCVILHKGNNMKMHYIALLRFFLPVVQYTSKSLITNFLLLTAMGYFGISEMKKKRYMIKQYYYPQQYDEQITYLLGSNLKT